MDTGFQEEGLQNSLRAEVGTAAFRAVLVHPALLAVLWFSSTSIREVGVAFWGLGILLSFISTVRVVLARRIASLSRTSGDRSLAAYGLTVVLTGFVWGSMGFVVMVELGPAPVTYAVLAVCSAVAAGAVGSFVQLRLVLVAYVWLLIAPIAIAAVLFWRDTEGWQLIGLGSLLYAAVLSTMGSRRASEHIERLRMAIELRRQNQEVEQAGLRIEFINQKNAQFIRDMAEEIQAPVQDIIRTGRELSQTSTSRTQRGLLQSLEESGGALDRVMKDVLDYSVADDVAPEIEAMEFDPADCLEVVAGEVSAAADFKGLALDVILDPKVPRQVCGDSGRIRQVLRNLLSNAIKFTEQGAVGIEMRCRSVHDDEVELEYSVFDTGPGVPEALQERIFAAFVHCGATTRPPRGGSGMGLAICARLVELMRGRISFSSEPGGGARFTFQLTLPVVRRPRTQSLRHVETVQVLSSRASGRRALFSLLELAGSSVHAVGSTEDLQSATVDLVIAEVDGDEDPELARLLEARRQGAIRRLVLVCRCRDKLVIQKKVGSLTEDVLTHPVSRRNVEEALWPERAVSCDIPTLAWARPRPEGGPRRILVVEDSPINQMLAKRFLERAGYEAVLANDGQEGVEAVGREDWDAVLMDCQMPNMDGMTATRRIREQEAGSARHVPIVAMTPHSLEEDSRRALAAGMDAYLTKPLQPQEMLRVLEEQIATSPRGGAWAPYASARTMRSATS